MGDFLFFLGKLVITLLSTLLGLYMLQDPGAVPEMLDAEVGRYWSIPLLLIAIFAWVIASCFMAVYDMAVNTIFLCFCKISCSSGDF